jgi:WD40 repeat protein
MISARILPRIVSFIFLLPCLQMAIPGAGSVASAQAIAAAQEPAREPQWPQPLVQAGHTDWVNATAYSPKEPLLASVGKDGRLCIWDLQKNIEVDEYLLDDEGHGVTFSPDGQFVAVAANKQIVVWDVHARKKVWELSSIGSAYAVAFSHDSQDLFAAYYDQTAQRYQISRFRAKEFEKLSAIVTENPMWYLAVNGAGSKVYAAALQSNHIRTWNGITGAPLDDIKTDFPITAFAVAADGSTVAVSVDKGPVEPGSFTKGGEILIFHGSSRVSYVPQAVDLFSHKLGPTIIVGMKFDESRHHLLASGQGHLWILDLGTGKEIRTIETPYWGSISVDSQFLQAAIGRENQIILLNLQDPKRFVTLAGSARAAGTLAVRGKNLLLSGKNSVDVWLPEDGKEFSVRQDCPFQSISVSQSASGRHFLTFCSNNGIGSEMSVWDGQNGASLAKFGGPFEQPRDLEFASFLPNRETIVVGQTDGFPPGNQNAPCTMHIFSAETGKVVQSFRAHEGPCHQIRFSASGKTAVTDQFLKEYQFWDTATWKLLLTLPEVYSPELSDDGTLVAARTGALLVVAPEFFIKNLKTGQTTGSFGKVLMSNSAEQNKHESAWAWTWIPKTTNLVAGYADGSVRVFDGLTGRELYEFARLDQPPTRISLSPDGTKLLASFEKRDAEVWNFKSRVKLHDIDTAGSVLDFSSDGNWVLASGGHGFARLISARDGSTKLSLLPVEAGVNQSWLAVTPTGLFDGTPAGWGLVSWRFSDALFDILPGEIYFNDFFRPGVVADVLMERKLPTVNIANVDRSVPEVRISTALEGATSSEREVEISVEVETTKGSGARDLGLFRNGVQVQKWKGNIPLGADGRAKLSAHVTLAEGKNEFTAYAFSKANLRSMNHNKVVITGSKALLQEPAVYIISVGLNHYSDPDLADLRYSVADADSFAEAVKKALPGWPLKTVTLRDQDATKTNILDAIRALGRHATTEHAALLDSSAAAKPEDKVFFYFAGHGASIQNQFYLLPHDARLGASAGAPQTASSIFASMVSDKEMADAFEDVRAGTIAVVLDACDSGQALEGEDHRVGPLNAVGLAQLAYNKGMALLAASQSSQEAQELSSLGHGLLTYVLIQKGLVEKLADLNKDNNITIREWFEYATEEVPRMQVEKRKQSAAGRQGAPPKSESTKQIAPQIPRAYFGASSEDLIRSFAADFQPPPLN